MNIDRLKKLEKFLENDPDDPFLLYAIAIEWMDENPERTRGYFDKLLDEHEDYVGTYYHAARLYAAIGKNEKAEEIFRKGINIAEKMADHHALRELKSAYNEFLFDNEDED